MKKETNNSIEVDDIDEREVIQLLHVAYINSKLLRKQEVKLPIKNFKEYLTKYHKMSYLYYIELATRYNFELSE